VQIERQNGFGRRRVWTKAGMVAATGAAIVLAGCSASGTTGASTVHAPAAVHVGRSSLGAILTDGRGRSVYLFEKDHGRSTCYGACGGQWPPVETAGAPVPGTGTMPSLVGTAARTDGAIQVTYAGHPLYYFAGDNNPGDTTGEGLQNFGGGWDLVSPAGQKVEQGGH